MTAGAATLVWMAPDAPDVTQARALAAWASAHGVKLTMPESARPSTIVVNESDADDVERLLDRVRDAIAARDADGADRALAAAESTVRAHPELPQAAWLMAEVERARSTRFRRIAPLDEGAADRAWMLAEALDGGRVPGVGEQASAGHPAAASITLAVDPPGATLWVDGRRVSGVVATHAGEHALAATYAGSPVWASWVETPAGSSTLRLAVPAPPPCSTGDVSEARASADGIDASLVRCSAWVVASPGQRPGTIEVAMCEPGRCGPLLPWNAPATWTWTPPPEHSEGGWPTWATFGLVGAGAVIATGVVLVASGVFQAAPAETRFVSGGVKTQ